MSDFAIVNLRLEALRRFLLEFTSDYSAIKDYGGAESGVFDESLRRGVIQLKMRVTFGAPEENLTHEVVCHVRGDPHYGDAFGPIKTWIIERCARAVGRDFHDFPRWYHVGMAARLTEAGQALVPIARAYFWRPRRLASAFDSLPHLSPIIEIESARSEPKHATSHAPQNIAAAKAEVHNNISVPIAEKGLDKRPAGK